MRIMAIFCVVTLLFSVIFQNCSKPQKNDSKSSRIQPLANEKACGQFDYASFELEVDNSTCSALSIQHLDHSVEVPWIEITSEVTRYFVHDGRYRELNRSVVEKIKLDAKTEAQVVLNNASLTGSPSLAVSQISETNELCLNLVGRHSLRGSLFVCRSGVQSNSLMIDSSAPPSSDSTQIPLEDDSNTVAAVLDGLSNKFIDSLNTAITGYNDLAAYTDTFVPEARYLLGIADSPIDSTGMEQSLIEMVDQLNANAVSIAAIIDPELEKKAALRMEIEEMISWITNSTDLTETEINSRLTRIDEIKSELTQIKSNLMAVKPDVDSYNTFLLQVFPGLTI